MKIKLKEEFTSLEFIKSYLDEYLSSGALKNFSVFVCREDGHLLYNRDYMNMGISYSSVGALLGGVWQAATTLASFIPNSETDGIYRLSFDTSSEGIYILPFELVGEHYSLGLLYRDEMNPGFIKSRLRDLLMKMTIEIEKTKFKTVSLREGYLFDNITDEEMDNVFRVNGEGSCHS